MAAMIDRDSHEPLINSIVLLSQDELAMPSLGTISELEGRFGSFVDASGVLSPLGPAVNIKIPKRNLEILLSTKKIEFHHKGMELDPESADSIADAIHIMNDFLTVPNWKALGYNYNVMSKNPQGNLASVAIADNIVDRDLGTRMNYQLLGASATLFIEVEEFVLTLKIEPRGASRDTKSIWIQGNFETRPVDQLPTLEQLAESYKHCHDMFFDIIGKF